MHKAEWIFYNSPPKNVQRSVKRRFTPPSDKNSSGEPHQTGSVIDLVGLLLFSMRKIKFFILLSTAKGQESDTESIYDSPQV